MISVIIPTYNRRCLLKKTIESVLSQTFSDFELLIVDDGSSDGTREEYSNSTDRRLKYFFQKNKGPAAARNLGIKKAEGGLIAFVDSDDWWDKRKLGIQSEAMSNNRSYYISHTRETWFRNGELFNQKKRHRKEHGHLFKKCLELCAVSMSTVMLKREVFDTVGLFDESMPCCEDYDFWIRTGALYDFLLVDKPLTLKDGGRKDQVSYLYRTGMDRFRIESIVKLLDSGSLNEEQSSLAKKELTKKAHIYTKGCQKHGKPREAERVRRLSGKFPLYS